MFFCDHYKNIFSLNVCIIWIYTTSTMSALSMTIYPPFTNPLRRYGISNVNMGQGQDITGNNEQGRQEAKDRKWDIYNINRIKNHIKIKDTDRHKRLQNKSTKSHKDKSNTDHILSFQTKLFLNSEGCVVLLWLMKAWQRTAVCDYLMDYLIMCWRQFRNLQRRSLGAMLFFILLSSFWVKRETLSALRLMSKSTILDKINKWAHSNLANLLLQIQVCCPLSMFEFPSKHFLL